MQIKLHTKPADTIPNAYTRILLAEKGVEQLVRTDDILALEIVAGKNAKITPRTLRTLIRSIVQSAKKHKLEKIALHLEYAAFPKCAQYGEAWFWSTVVENIFLANYEYTVYKSKPAKEVLKEILLVTEGSKEAGDRGARGHKLWEHPKNSPNHTKQKPG
jgi:leucyl aminopeptidase